MKKSIVLIPLPSLIKNSFVSFVRSLSLSLSLSLSPHLSLSLYRPLSLSLSVSYCYSVSLLLLLLSFVVPLGCVAIVSRTGCPKAIRA